MNLPHAKAIAVFILLPALGWMSGCRDRVEPTLGTAQDPNPLLKQVANEPDRYLGRRVTISGEVEEVTSPRAFRVEGDDGILFEKELLVVAKSDVRPGGNALEEGDTVVVTGKVAKLRTTEIERDIGWDLQPELEVEWRDKAVLIAEDVSKTMPYARWSEKEQQGSNVGLVSLWVAPDPLVLAGTTLSLPNATVRRKTNKGFWVGKTHFSQLFVVPSANQLSSVDVGDEVSVQGTLRRMPPASEAIARWDMDPALSTQIAEEPLYLEASQVSELSEAQAASNASTKGTVQWAALEKSAPERFAGKQVKGEAKVKRVISDRAFWLDSGQGKQVLAVVREDVPKKEMIDIDAGQTLRFKADVLTSKDAAALKGSLEADAKEAIDKEPLFLSMHWRDVSQIALNDKPNEQ